MPAKKKAPAKKAAKKVAAKKKTSIKKTAKKSAENKAPAKKAASSSVKTTKAVVSRTGVAADKKSTPIVFSIDDIEELMASKKSEKEVSESKPKAKAVEKPKVTKKVIVEEKPVEKRVLGAASLADILGFNPGEKASKTSLEEEEIPKKWQKYYKLLIELRSHVSDEIDLHTSDTLKHSSREDSGDLSNYGNHQADAGTDTFDRDFALSLVSNEQDALHEIEEAIQRIKDGSYGVCEETGKAIPAARLTAVPFARFSVEGQAEYEKNNRRKSDRSSGNVGIFGDVDAPKITTGDDDDE